jgi:hypothetical protein
MKSKSNPEFDETPQAATRFRTIMKQILSVPRSEILKREAEYQKRIAQNPRKRGPKRKIKSSVNHAPAADV